MLLSCLWIFVFQLILIDSTFVRTFPTLDIEENLPIESEIIDFKVHLNLRELILLNLNDFERDLFLIENRTLIIRNEIDREEFLQQRRCSNEDYCLIELHFIVNSGDEYWILPLHIVE
jgi:hypothetical protein